MDSSDEDNEFSYNFPNMYVSAKGPNLSKFGNKNMMGTKPMTRGFVQPEDTRSVYDQRSINSRRELSPRSLRSVCDFQPRNFLFSNYPPLKPMGSTDHASATDIALSLRNKEFNILDVEIIKRAYKAFMKRFKELDSGEQGSESSLSNDDDRFTRNFIFNENMSSSKSTNAYSTSSRTSRQRQRSAYKGRSANFSQNSCRNINPLNISNLRNNSQVGKFNFQPLQKDRFKNIYTFPSQRFNSSVAATTIPENVSQVQPTVTRDVNKGLTYNDNNTVANIANERNHEPAFSEVPAGKNSCRKASSSKRKLDEDQSIAITSKKRQKLSPIKNNPDLNKTSIQNTELIDKDETNDFCFIKPSLPLTKSSKAKIGETLVSKSSQSLLDIAPTDKSVNKSFSESTENSTSNVSTRPSFMKRNLFTPKVDVIENKNISNDNNVNSPINVSNQMQKEKNKTRKIVSNQSCLNRAITQETSIIDLIHKIVPPSQLNSTTKADVRNECHAASIISECQDADESDTYTDEDIFEQNATGKTKRNKLKRNGKKQTLLKDCQVVIEKKNISINCNGNATSTPNNDKEKLTGSDKHKNLEANDKKNQSKVSTFRVTDLEDDAECQNTQKKLPKYLNKDKVPDNKTQTMVRTNRFWETDLESDDEFLVELQNKLPKPLNKDKAPEESHADQNQDNNDNSNNSEQAFDNNSAYSSTSNISKFKNLNIRVRSHRAPKKIKCCPEPELPINKVPDVSVNFNSQDNNQAEDIENNKNEGVIMKKNSATRKVAQNKQSDVEAAKCTNKIPAAKTKLKRDTKSNINSKTSRGQAKQRVANKHITLSESVSDVSFSLLDTTVMTRSRTRNKINNSTLSK